MKESNLPKEHISFTQINTYSHCPRLYKYHYIDKIKSDSKDRIYGSFLHKVLAEVNLHIKGMKDKSQLGIEDIERIYSDEFKRVNLSLESYKKGYQNIEKIALETFQSRASIYLVEEEVKIELNHKGRSILLDCIVDRVDKVLGGLKITDYKTSALIPSRDDVLHNLQLNIYGLTFKELLPESTIFLEQYSINAGKSVKEQADDTIMAKTRDYIIDLWMKMENDKEWNPSPSVNNYCQYCPKVCEVYIQQMFEKYENKGVKDIKSAVSRFLQVRDNRLLAQKEEDSLKEYIKGKFDQNAGEYINIGDKEVGFTPHTTETKKIDKEKICKDCKAITFGESPYQKIDIKTLGNKCEKKTGQRKKNVV